MKVLVMRCDGQTETLNLIGTIQVAEPSPSGQGSLLIESTGTTHFFCAVDGAYDGWGMEVTEIEDHLDEKGILAFIEAVEKDRKIHEVEKGA